MMSPLRQTVLAPLALVVLTAAGVGAAERDEEPLPPGAVLRLGSPRLSLAGQPRGIAFSPDGKTLAGCGGDDTVRLWDVATGKDRAVLRTRPYGVVRLAYSTDGKRLAGCSRGFGVVWDATTLKEVLRFSAGNCQALAFSPDGGLLAVGDDDGSTALVDAKTGKEITRFKGHDKWVWTLAFSPDGKTLATGSFDGTARLWDVNERAALGVIETRTNGFSAVGFLPEGNTVLLGGQDGKVSFFDLDARKVVNTVAAGNGGLTSLAVRGDGTVLATATEQTVRLWDTATGKEIRRIENLPRAVHHLAFSADGRTLATAGLYAGRVQLWDAATGQELHPNDGHHGLVSSAHLTPDGKAAVTASYDRTVRVWDLGTGKVRHTLDLSEASFLTTALSADGKLIAAGTVRNKVRLYEPDTGKLVREIAAPPGDVTALAFTPDGKHVLAGLAHGAVRVWDVGGTELATLAGHENAVFDLAVAADGKTLASGSQGASVRLWDLAARKEVRQCRSGGGVGGVVLSPDGKSVACGDGRQVRVFDVATGEARHTLLGHQATVLKLAFSPDGRLLVSSGADRALVVWDLEAGRPVARPITGRDTWFSLAMSADGKRLLSGGSDTTAMLWDMEALSKPAAEAKPLAAEELDRLWGDLGGDDLAAAHVAVWDLARQPKVEVYLKERLFGKQPAGLEKRVRKLIEELDSDEFPVRENASKELRKLGPAVGPILNETLAGTPSLEVRRRIEFILEGLKAQKDGLTPAEAIRGSRVILALEWVGTKDAQEVLRALVFTDPPSQLTAEAREALSRLEKRPAERD
jgi:WD40 repeat protein